MSEQINFEIQKVAYRTASIWLKKKYHKEDNELYIHRAFTDGTFTMAVSGIRLGNKSLKDLRYEFSIDNENKCITVVSKVLAYSDSKQTVAGYNDMHDVGLTIPFNYYYDDVECNTLSTDIKKNIENEIREYTVSDLKGKDHKIRVISSNSNTNDATYYMQVVYTEYESIEDGLPINYEFTYHINGDEIACTKVTKFVVDSMHIYPVKG